MTETQTNREIVRRAFEAWRDDGAAITNLFAPDMVWRITAFYDSISFNDLWTRIQP